jgi:hypothetical protein
MVDTNISEENISSLFMVKEKFPGNVSGPRMAEQGGARTVSLSPPSFILYPEVGRSFLENVSIDIPNYTASKKTILILYLSIAYITTTRTQDNM